MAVIWHHREIFKQQTHNFIVEFLFLELICFIIPSILLLGPLLRKLSILQHTKCFVM